MTWNIRAPYTVLSPDHALFRQSPAAVVPLRSMTDPRSERVQTRAAETGGRRALLVRVHPAVEWIMAPSPQPAICAT